MLLPIGHCPCDLAAALAATAGNLSRTASGNLLAITSMKQVEKIGIQQVDHAQSAQEKGIPFLPV